MTQSGGVTRGAKRKNVGSLWAALRAFVCVPVALLLLFAQPAGAQNLSFEEIEKLPAPTADRRIAYGEDPLQFGDLRLPPGKGSYPVVVVIVAARRRGDDVRLVTVREAGHFDLIAPQSSAWPAVQKAISSLLNSASR